MKTSDIRLRGVLATLYVVMIIAGGVLPFVKGKDALGMMPVQASPLRGLAAGDVFAIHHAIRGAEKPPVVLRGGLAAIERTLTRVQRPDELAGATAALPEDRKWMVCVSTALLDAPASETQ